MLGNIKDIIKNLKIKLGYIYCPFCKQLIKPKYVKDYIYHSEEPPMFYHYECPKCKLWLCEPTPSALTERAVRKLGYKDFNDYMGKVAEDIINEYKLNNGKKN